MFRALQHPLDAEPHNIPPREERLFRRDQVVGRHRPAHHQESCSDILAIDVAPGLTGGMRAIS
jgi:hypothetical protein